MDIRIRPLLWAVECVERGTILINHPSRTRTRYRRGGPRRDQARGEEREGQGRSGTKRRYRAGAALPEELVLTELTEDGPVRKEDAVGRVLAREESEEEEEEGEEERSSRKRQWR